MPSSPTHPETRDKSAHPVLTIGHSTRTWSAFVALLLQFRVDLLADVRRFPASRRFPQFHRQHLRDHLPAEGVAYRWMEPLGGRRRGGDEGVDAARFGGLRNESFRAYAAYMHTPAFQRAIEELMEIASERRTAILCAEAVYWRCHRRLISDTLVARGVEVQHIMSDRRTTPHKLTDAAQIRGENVIYPPPLFRRTAEE